MDRQEHQHAHRQEHRHDRRHDRLRTACLGHERGGGALARALDRWRRVLAAERAASGAPGSAVGGAGLAGDAAGTVTGSAVGGVAGGLAELARRLDDSGCAYGRVSAARIEQLTRAYERLETKLNAVLLAVTGTFLSTLAGLLLYYVRGGSH